MANVADLNLIQINNFPEVESPEDWIVVSDAAGLGYKISKENFKAFLGTVTVSTPKPIGPADGTPELDGVYIPTVVGTYPNFGGLERLESDGYVQFIKNGAVYAKVNTEIPHTITPDWTGATSAGEQRMHRGQMWKALVNTTEEQEPGIAPETVWRKEITGYIESKELPKITGDVIIPEGVSDVVFASQTPYELFFGLPDIAVTPENPLSTFNIKAIEAGEIVIAFVKDSGSTGDIIYEKTVAIPTAGIYTYTADDLEVPDLSPHGQVLVLVRNKNATSRPMGYVITGTGGVGVTMNASNNTLTYDNEGYLFNYWIELKVFNLKEISSILNGEPLDSIALPADRSDVVFSALTANPGLFFAEEETFFTPETNFISITIKSPVSGPVAIAFFTVSGASTNLLFQKEVNVVAGLNRITAEELGLPDMSTQTKVFVFVRNLSNIVSERPIVYNEGSQRYIYIDANTLIAQPAEPGLYLNYWIEVGEFKGLSKTVNILSRKINSINTVTEFSELQGALSGKDIITLSDGIYNIEEPINVPAGKTIVGSRNAIFRLANGVSTGFNIDNVEDVKLSGFTMDGGSPLVDVYSDSIISNGRQLADQVNIGTRKGIYVTQTQGTIFEDLFIRNFDHSGLHAYHLNTSIYGNFGRGIKARGLNFQDCYFGLHSGQQAEYSTFEGISATRCIGGIIIYSGNITVSNSQFTQCKIGGVVGAGSNNSHGGFDNCSFNHAPTNGVWVDAIDHGFVFSACQFFDGIIEMQGSRGVLITSSIIASKIVANLTADKTSKISNCIWKEDTAYETGTIIKTGLGKLVLSNNDFMDNKNNSTINGIL